MGLCDKCCNVEKVVFDSGPDFLKCGMYNINIKNREVVECSGYEPLTLFNIFGKKISSYMLEKYLSEQNPILIDIKKDGKVGFRKGKDRIY